MAGNGRDAVGKRNESMGSRIFSWESKYFHREIEIIAGNLKNTCGNYNIFVGD
jgi:hypothetical protein